LSRLFLSYSSSESAISAKRQASAIGNMQKELIKIYKDLDDYKRTLILRLGNLIPNLIFQTQMIDEFL